MASDEHPYHPHAQKKIRHGIPVGLNTKCLPCGSLILGQVDVHVDMKIHMLLAVVHRARP